jgi:hypothetical protein
MSGLITFYQFTKIIIQMYYMCCGNNDNNALYESSIQGVR